MSEIEVEIEEIQDFPKVIDPTQMNFIYGSFTSDKQPVERLLSFNEADFNNINIQIPGNDDYYSKKQHSNQFNKHPNKHYAQFKQKQTQKKDSKEQQKQDLHDEK